MLKYLRGGDQVVMVSNGREMLPACCSLALCWGRGAAGLAVTRLAVAEAEPSCSGATLAGLLAVLPATLYQQLTDVCLGIS